MSKEQVELFEELLRQKRELAMRLWSADRESFLETYVKIGTESGFRFSADEALAAGIPKKYESIFGAKVTPINSGMMSSSVGGLSSDVDGLLRINNGRVDW